MFSFIIRAKQKNSQTLFYQHLWVFYRLYQKIPVVGFEPTLPRGNGILSPARLPIPPHRHDRQLFMLRSIIVKVMEAATGFEPVIKVLQTLALPLGYAAL